MTVRRGSFIASFVVWCLFFKISTVQWLPSVTPGHMQYWFIYCSFRSRAGEDRAGGWPPIPPPPPAGLAAGGTVIR
ncbi:hypothetical protein GUJ93_ZPchr0012g20385 [Zizania palustris]|uniref:Secreted protein n=1 Tax=Zizania palustris TaxID=103762 RepID=A0A8J5WRF4_ZIZPA|nr:hypothetical protein GUJ93_ZPchr0012g20385 [Zizania palustris]